MTDIEPGPIVMGSVFKSGTWLLRRVLTALTGLEPLEPEIRPGRFDPRDPRHLCITDDRFFSWHFTPTEIIGSMLRERHARVIFLQRNVYDLVISMYHHFLDDIDADIGRSAGQSGYFSRLDRDEGLRRIILPSVDTHFPWPGIGEHLEQMSQMLEFATTHPCVVTTFERLQQDRAGEIRRIARYLGIEVDEQEVSEICASSTLERMRAEAAATGSGSHFRNGRTGAHAAILNEGHVALLRSQLQHHAPHLPELARSAGLEELLYCALPGVASPTAVSCV